MDSFKKRILNLYRVFNKNLKVLESLQVQNPAEPLPNPVVFILGAPRSGTTLVYQSIVTAFDFSYFSNAHCRLFGAPWLVEKVFRPSDRFQRSTFKSRFGFIQGWKAPSECGDFWYRFFPRRPQYTPLENTNPKKMSELRTAIFAFQKISGKPLLIKNLPCSLRLEPIQKILPEAIFLVVCRDETDTAHSILDGRMKMYGDYEEWFSLEPPNINQIKKLAAPGQAVEQIRAVNKIIAEAQQGENSHRFMNICYENFCSNPNKELEGIQSFFRQHNIEPLRKSNLPESFEQRQKVTIDTELYNELLQYVKSHPYNE